MSDKPTDKDCLPLDEQGLLSGSTVWAMMAAKDLLTLKENVTDLRKRQVEEKRVYYTAVIQRAINYAVNEEHNRLRKILRDVYITVIQVPVVYRGDAIRWARLCDDILHEIGEDPIKTALEYYILECDCGWGGTSEGLEEKQEWWECPKCSGTAQPPNEI